MHHLPVSSAKRDDISDNVELCDVGYSQVILSFSSFRYVVFAGLSSFND